MTGLESLPSIIPWAPDRMDGGGWRLEVYSLQNFRVSFLSTHHYGALCRLHPVFS